MPKNMFKPSSDLFTDYSKAMLFVGHFCDLCLTFVFIYCTVWSVAYSLVTTCWERAVLLFLLCVMFPCVFVTFPYGVSGQMRYLIVWIPDLCLLFFYCHPQVDGNYI